LIFLFFDVWFRVLLLRSIELNLEKLAKLCQSL
jgi:hypothetical protein